MDAVRREVHEVRSPVMDQVRSLQGELEALKTTVEEMRAPLLVEMRNLQRENEGFLKELERTQNNYRALVTDFLCQVDEKGVVQNVEVQDDLLRKTLQSLQFCTSDQLTPLSPRATSVQTAVTVPTVYEAPRELMPQSERSLSHVAG